MGACSSKHAQKGDPVLSQLPATFLSMLFDGTAIHTHNINHYTCPSH